MGSRFRRCGQCTLSVMSGRFIVLEGPDGSGTTTHAKLLAQRLGANVFLTAEPTDGPIGKEIRAALKQGALPPDELQMLFVKDRAWHIKEEIGPALEKGMTVVCDRYIASTLAYGEALGLDQAWLEDLNKKFVQPSSQVFLLPPIEVCWQRMGARNAKDSLETRELQDKVHAAYHAIAKRHGIPVIDSTGSIEHVAAIIAREVQKH